MGSRKLSARLGDNNRLLFEREGRATLGVGFMRTLRLPQDGVKVGLPPSLGTFPLRRARDYADRVPSSWLHEEGVFLPLSPREGMWVSFVCPERCPHAIKVGVGESNAVSGKTWCEELADGSPPDFLVCPQQSWLDGYRSGEGPTRQFTLDGHGSSLKLVIYPPKTDFQPPPQPPSEFSGFRFPVSDPRVLELVSQELLDKGLLTKDQVFEAQRAAGDREDGLLLALMVREWVDLDALEEMTAQANASLLGIPYSKVENPSSELRHLIPSDLGRRYKVFPVGTKENNVLTLAMLDPLDEIALDDLFLITGFEIEVVQGSFSAIQRALQTYGDAEEGGPARGDLPDLDTATACEPEPGRARPVVDHGVETFDKESRITVEVYFVDGDTWTRLTGEPPPETPVCKALYDTHGYPWLEL